MKDLSICIVNYNTSKMLDRLLASIYQGTREITFEVLIVDNASTDAVQEVVRLYHEADFVCNDANVYFTRADNQNLVRAKGRYVVSLNPDSLVLSGALERMVDFLENHPDVGAVSPKFVFPDGTLQPSFGRFLTLIYGILEAAGINMLFPNNGVRQSVMTSKLSYDPERVQEAEVLYGACIMVRREVLETVGLKDEKLVHGWDEYDWCRRMAERGWRLCYVPDATVLHYRGASRKQETSQNKLWQYHWDGFLYLYRKHWGIHVYWLLRILRCAPKALLFSRRCVIRGLRYAVSATRRSSQ